MTPYSPTSLDRGLDGLLVSVARVLQAPLDDGLSEERSAWRIKEHREVVERVAERLKARISAAALDEVAVKYASDRLVNRIDRWVDCASRASDMHRTLVYERTGKETSTCRC